MSQLDFTPRRLTLSRAVLTEGFALVIDPSPNGRADRIGDAGAGAFAQLCSGTVIACKADSWDYAFAVSHEIAEARCPGHSEGTWTEQANVLARWCRRLGAE